MYHSLITTIDCLKAYTTVFVLFVVFLLTFSKITFYGRKQDKNNMWSLPRSNSNSNRMVAVLNNATCFNDARFQESTLCLKDLCCLQGHQLCCYFF